MTKLTTAAALAGDAGPVSASDRIQALDVVRGVALCGILLMNIVGFGLPFQAYEDPTVMGGGTGANLTAWSINSLFFEGTMRTLFSMLFGAGVVLLTSRADRRGDGRTAKIFIRRNLWLVVFGIVHAYLLIWSGEILYTYGIVGLLLFVFRKRSAKTLLALGVAVLALQSAQRLGDMRAHRSAYETYEQAQAAGVAEDERAQASAAWEAVLKEEKPSQEALQASVNGYRQESYLDVVAYNAPISFYVETLFFLHFFLLDAMGAMLLGMALFKMGVLTGERATGVYLWMAAVGYAVGISVNYWEVRLLIDNSFSIFAFDRAALTYDVGRLAVTAGHIGVVMLFAKSGVLGWLRRALGAVGRMALTNYVMHTVICIFVFYGFGLGLFGRLERHELYYVVFAIWLFQLIVSPLWLTKFRFGPLEWAWRSLTYWKRQRMFAGG